MLKLAHDLHSHGCSCLGNSDLVLVLLALFTALSMHSYIIFVASHLDTLDVERMDVEHVKTEPQDGVW